MITCVKPFKRKGIESLSQTKRFESLQPDGVNIWNYDYLIKQLQRYRDYKIRVLPVICIPPSE